MTYFFSTSSASRGYYLVADEPVEVEGTTLSLTMDVRGDGSGAWPRLQVTDGNGTVTNLDGDHLDFEGWQTVRFTVPDGLAQPLTVERIRMMETRRSEEHTSELQSRGHLVCRLLLEKKKTKLSQYTSHSR